MVLSNVILSIFLVFMVVLLSAMLKLDIRKPFNLLIDKVYNLGLELRFKVSSNFK